MRLKLAQTLALATLLAVLSGVAVAGSVQVGLLGSSSYDDLICGVDVPLSAPNGPTSCGSAKFANCSDCQDVAVRNQSNSRVKLRIKIIGAGFAPPCRGGGGFGGYGKCPSGKSITLGSGDDCGDSLDPGKSCTQSIEFCPEKAGESQGEMRVSVTAGSAPPKLTVFHFAGSGDYPQELAAADEARRGQLERLMKIPYVAKVELDTENHDIAINVEVTEDDKIVQVRRLVAPKIGGYRTEVTTYMHTACAE